MTATANQEMQRTAPRVTAAASTATFPPPMQPPRRAPQSLISGSFGDSSRPVKRIILTLLLIAGVTLSLAAAIKDATTEVFERSACLFSFAIPESFGGILGGFMGAPDRVGEVAQKRSWQDPDTYEIITVKWTRFPKAVWDAKLPKEMFAQVKADMMAHAGMKLLSERAYERDGYPAYSLVFDYEGQPYCRMDCILTRPEMNLVSYYAPTLDTEVSKKFFASISIKAKPATK